MIFLPPAQALPPPIDFSIGNDRRSPFRFKVTNVSWNEAKEGVIIEAFEGPRPLARLPWKDGLPNVYMAKARRQGRSGDILIAATCDGNQTQYTAVWLFSAKTKRLKLLADKIDNADDSRLATGKVMEENVDRWIDDPPTTRFDGTWFHRTWTYERKTQRLIPGPWRRGMFHRSL